MKKGQAISFVSLTFLILILITNIAVAEDGIKAIDIKRPKTIVVDSLDNLDESSVNPGDIIKVDESLKYKFSTYTEDDILATYTDEEFEITYKSYSNTFSTTENLIQLHNELMKNVHYKEMNKLGEILIYPDGPAGTLGVTNNIWYQEALWVGNEIKYFPFQYGDDIKIEIYQTEQSYHDEMNEIIPTLSHEYGHLFTFNYMIEAHHQLPSDTINDYVKIRGIEGNTELREDYSNGHKWSVAEIMAEDYRILFGPEEDTNIHENQEIPDVFSESVHSDVVEFWNNTLLNIGAGTKSDPYIIETEYQLSQIGLYDGGKANYKLIKDIDLVYHDFIEHVGNWFPINNFEGVLDGNGHKIIDLRLENYFKNENHTAYYGLFRVLNGTVKNLHLNNLNVSGDRLVGGLVGYLDSNGIVTNCMADGYVSGDEYAGGLIGYNNKGIIKNNYSDTTINGNKYFGGLLGRNDGGQVLFNYTTGTVLGSNYSGGLVGINTNLGTISNNVAINERIEANVEEAYIGRIVGAYNENSIPTNNYALETLTLGNFEVISDINDLDGLNKSLENLQKESTYKDLGWDFNNDWVMHVNTLTDYWTLPMPKVFLVNEEYVYDSNGVLKYINEYIADKIKYSKVYENGKLSYKNEYDENENIIAKYTFYKDENGKYKYKYKYVYKSTGALEYKEEFYADKKIAKYTYYIDENGKYRYKFKYEYDTNGNKKYKYEYEDGKIIAKYTYYLASNGTYRYKLKYVYDTNGNKKYKYEYEDGKIIAKYTYYLASNGTYRYKLKYVYDTNGNKKYKYEYEDGKILAKYTYYLASNGTYRYKLKYVYDSNGNKKYKYEYKDGKIIAKYTYYLASNGTYRYKLKYIYDSNGNKKYKYEYKDGKKIAKYTYYKASNGTYRYKYRYLYDLNGTLYVKYQYSDGKKIYKYTYYIDENGKYRYKYKYEYDSTGLHYAKRYTYEAGVIIDVKIY